MSKCKLVLLSSLLLLSALFVSCKPNVNTYTVTFKLGDYAVEETSGASTYTLKVSEGSVIKEIPAFVIKPEYKGQVSLNSFVYENTEDAGINYQYNHPIYSDVTLVAKYSSVNVTNLAVKQNSTKSFLVTWDYLANSEYEYELIDPATRLNPGYSYNEFDDGCLEIFPPDNNDYIFTIKRLSTLEDVDNSAIEYKELTVSLDPEWTNHTEWLMLMYMDGDNNLNDPLYLDLNEAENGLAKLPDDASVRVIALWDGWDFKSGNDDGDTSFFDYFPGQYNTNKSATRLLELGPDKGPIINGENSGLYTEDGGIYYEACMLSSSTIDLTATVDWIKDGEVNMASKETLREFLNWAILNYSADKIILQFSDHGGGPRAAASSERPSFGRRSMCWDETSGGNGFLKTSDVSKALYGGGFGDGKKVSLIMEDVCLGGSLEEAYELHDYADYYVGSPNNVPGNGFDYISFVSSLTKGATVEEVGCNLVKTYKSNYEWSENRWNNYLQNNPSFANYDGLNKSLMNEQLSTLSFVDLSKIEAVESAVNDLAYLINNDDGKETRLKADSNGHIYTLYDDSYYYYNGTKASEDVELTNVSRRFALKWWTAYYGDPIYYDGTFGCLKDLGAMCEYMRQNYPEDSEYSWPELYEKTYAVTSALSSAIVACWRDGYKQPTYYKIGKEVSYSDVLGSSSDLGAGLTINCSCWVSEQGKDGRYYLYQRFADWYKNELAFGKDCSEWTKLIKNWWN
jgi:hypothetical protein